MPRRPIASANQYSRGGGRRKSTFAVERRPAVLWASAGREPCPKGRTSPFRIVSRTPARIARIHRGAPLRWHRLAGRESTSPAAGIALRAKVAHGSFRPAGRPRLGARPASGAPFADHMQRNRDERDLTEVAAPLQPPRRRPRSSIPSGNVPDGRLGRAGLALSAQRSTVRTPKFERGERKLSQNRSGGASPALICAAFVSRSGRARSASPHGGNPPLRVFRPRWGWSVHHRDSSGARKIADSFLGCRPISIARPPDNRKVRRDRKAGWAAVSSITGP